MYVITPSKNIQYESFFLCLHLFVASVIYTIRVFKGSNIQLPCHLPQSSEGELNAKWFKQTGDEWRQLNLSDGSTDGDERVEQLYPGDYDQTIMVRDAAIEDHGIYKCESPEGKKLSTVQVIVEGRSGNLFHILKC